MAIDPAAFINLKQSPDTFPRIPGSFERKSKKAEGKDRIYTHGEKKFWQKKIESMDYL